MKIRLLNDKGKQGHNEQVLVIPRECVSDVQFLYPRYYVLALALRVSVRPSYICLTVCLSGRDTSFLLIFLTDFSKLDMCIGFILRISIGIIYG